MEEIRLASENILRCVKVKKVFEVIVCYYIDKISITLTCMYTAIKILYLQKCRSMFRCSLHLKTRSAISTSY